MKLLAVYVGTTSEIGRINLQHGLQNGIWGFKEGSKPVDFGTLSAGDVILLATGHNGGGPRISSEDWAKHSLASIAYAAITGVPFQSVAPEWPDEASLAEAERYKWRVRFDPASIRTITNISLKDRNKLSAELAEQFRKSGAANGRGYVLDGSHFPVACLGNNDAKNGEAEIVSQLKARLQGGAAWGKHIEEFVASYGDINPADVAGLQTEQLWKLWTASKFAETGTPGLPTPTADQWDGVREMTRLLCDRSQASGARFAAAKLVCEKTFKEEQLQLPLILRTLLLLEGGRLGTIATKSYTNLLLKWAGKPELDYRDSASITNALAHVGELMEHWAAKVGATLIGDRARIPWYLCEIIRDGSPAKLNHWIFQGTPDQFDIDAYLRGRREIVWTVRQHKDRILTGDKVLLWKSGVAGGVIADCSVIAPPSKEILEDAPELWTEKPDIQTGEMRCRLRVEDSFVDTPIARAAIRSVLPELSIVKAPQGTNFDITQTDYEKIMKLREPSIREPFDAQSVDAFEHDLRDAGVVVSRTLVIRMLSSLASKNLVLLTGLAGSGKTKIAQALARWLPSSSNCFRVVAVGADWTGNENVLGYPNGLEKASYISKPSLEVILHAKANQAIPHFLILDEMNLSHVERYFADILSAIESDEKIHLHQDSERKANGTTIPAEVELPKNLFIIGTVNVDETTYMFSPKVLDRANVIEFRMDAGELEGFLGNPAKPDLSKLDGKGASFGKAFVDAAKNPVIVPAGVKAAYDGEMLLVFKTLQAHGAEFGYRTAYEAARFIRFYKLLGNHADGDTTWFPGAFDCVVFQKLLPKLHGSRAKLGPVLKKLWFLCVNDSAGRGADALKAAEEAARSTDKKAEPSVIVPAGAPYPLSAEKIGRMWRLLVENGFASFAEA